MKNVGKIDFKYLSQNEHDNKIVNVYFSGSSIHATTNNVNAVLMILWW